ncbi:hypothetical protein B0H12DRAFT_1155321 [Mycena haematopus]|nr:hypothetical protein B0H12DRAFT_1155321 [Mycena haematopus]
MPRLRSVSNFPPASSTFASLVFPSTGSDSEEPNNGKADLAKVSLTYRTHPSAGIYPAHHTHFGLTNRYRR